MNGSKQKDHRDTLRQKMETAGLHSDVIESFLYYYNRILNHETGLVYGKDIQPIETGEFEAFERLQDFETIGMSQLSNCAIILLNGGLGTGMGLTGPKSLLPVKSGRSFLDLKLSMAQKLNVEMVLMNSFSTDRDTRNYIEKHPESACPEMFVQNRFPKVLQSTYGPADWPANPDLEWNPPGHGEIYTCLFTTDILDRLLKKGKRYAFVCNSDNLGASVDASILGYFVKNKFPFFMEVATRTPSDLKGGHLARHKDGHLLLREIAQCPESELDAFQNIKKFHFFNTNNLWLDLVRLKELMNAKGSFRLPMILKSGNLDPRDDASPLVYQVEMAMGSAIANFKGATAICVPKSRFLPVKTCNDLLAVRSDCFVTTEANQIVMNPIRIERRLPALKIRLDSKYYRRIDDFDKRFQKGVPSLLDCESLTIDGDVFFEKNVTISGRVTITNHLSSPAIIPKDTVIARDLVFL